MGSYPGEVACTSVSAAEFGEQLIANMTGPASPSSLL
jgi:hypothetical protein